MKSLELARSFHRYNFCYRHPQSKLSLQVHYTTRLPSKARDTIQYNPILCYAQTVREEETSCCDGGNDVTSRNDVSVRYSTVQTLRNLNKANDVMMTMMMIDSS